MKKLSSSIIRSVILSLLLTFAVPISVSAEWVPNYGGGSTAGCYYYDGAYYTTPPTRAGVTYTYNGNTYVTVEDGCPASQKQVQPTNLVTQQNTNTPYWYDNSWHSSKPTQSGKDYFYLVDYAWHTTPANSCSSTTYNRPYYYDNDWHSSKPTQSGKDYWYDGTWYTTPTDYQDKPYYYDNAWHEKMPEEGGKDYWYEGEWRTTPNNWFYNANDWTNQWWWYVTQTTAKQQNNCSSYNNSNNATPYYWDGSWRKNPPTQEGKTYWFDGEWRTVPTRQQSQPAPTQRPSSYVDNYANTKASELVSFANQNGVAACYDDTTDNCNEAQKHISFSGSRGSFDMTLTTNIGSDGNLVVKYWRAGIQRSLQEIQNMVLQCK